MPLGKVSGVALEAWDPVLKGDPIAPRHRHLSPLETSQLQKQTSDWLGAKVVEKAPPNLPWVNNTVHVPKSNGTTRVCIDATPANQVTEDYDWPLPRLQDLRHHLFGKKWFARIDLRNAFFRLGVPVHLRHLVAYSCKGINYWFTRMPFGVKTAPAQFQRFMDHMLAIHKRHCFWYLDDILVSSETKGGLHRLTSRVVATLMDNGCDINWDKSEVETQGLLFAGIWIYHGGMGPNHHKRQAIRSLPVPHTKVDKQSALGLISWLRDYLPLASELTAVLSVRKGEKTKPVSETLWREFTCDVAERLTTLAHWQEDQDADLFTDASLTSCSAVLLQQGKIISLASRKLSPAETRYSTTDREHLGLVLAAHRFKIMLHRPRGVTRVLTDHSALLNRKWKDLTPRQTRWKVLVNTWIPRLEHVKGKNNPADYFSRWDVCVGGGQISCISS